MILFLSIGDDATDEEMFEYLLNYSNAFTIKVGEGSTYARYKVNSISEVAYFKTIIGMKLSLSFILSIVFAVGLVAFGFAFYQSSTEKTKLDRELELRASQVANDIIQNNRFFFRQPRSARVLDRFADSIIKQYNLLGIAVYLNNDSILSNSSTHNLIRYSRQYFSRSITMDSSLGNFFKSGQEEDLSVYYTCKIYLTGLKMLLFFILMPATLTSVIRNIWFRNFIGWFVQAFLVSLVTLLLIRWGIFRQINKIVDWAKAMRTGNGGLRPEPHLDILDPLHKEIEHMAKAMNEAKATAEEEARLRTSAEAIWTPERLKVEMENLLQNKKMIVVSNREPYMHIHDGKEIKCIVPASGMITAMEPILKACSGLWIASGTGDADKETVDKNDKVEVPPEDPKYTLRRLWLTKEEENHYYYGFSNEGLWPLCHIAHTRPIIQK